MVPRYFQLRAALPYTPTNKVQKAVLRTEGLSSDVWDRMAAGRTGKTSKSKEVQGASNAQ